jgi:hypothetical protein
MNSARTTVSLDPAHIEWIAKRSISLSKFLRKAIDEAMKEGPTNG